MTSPITSVTTLGASGLVLNTDGKEIVKKKRTKTGCITCRIRHVKCDEKKPACDTCTKTGRRCDRYGTPPYRDRKAMLSRHQSSKSFGAQQHTIIAKPVIRQASPILVNPGSIYTSPEQRAFQYFCTQTITTLSGHFGSTFWSSILLPASNEEPLIRHALLAISSLHEGFAVGGELRPENTRNAPYQHFALSQYTKAIALLARYQASIEDSKMSLIGLMACLLFVFFECARNNYNLGKLHLMNGLRVLCHYFHESSQEEIASPTSSISILRSELEKLFCQLIVQTSFLCGPYLNVQLIPRVSLNSAMEFSSIAAARSSLEDLFVATYPLLRSYKIPDTGLADLFTHQEMLSRQLQQWHTTFISLAADQHEGISSSDNIGIILLQIHFISLSIMLSTAIRPSKSDFVNLEPSFRSIVNLSETLLCPLPNSGTPLPKLTNFSFEMGVIPPLFYTVRRCGSPHIRRRAIELLHHAPYLEGIWGQAMASRLAQRFLELEEDAPTFSRVSKSLPSRSADREKRNSTIATSNSTSSQDASRETMNKSKDLKVKLKIKGPTVLERRLILKIGKEREELIDW